MFQVLQRVRHEVATEAVYLAGLRMRERGFIPDWRRWIVRRTGAPVFAASPAVAATLIEEIERQAAKPLAELSDAELDAFHRRIHDIMAERHAREYPDPDGIGERILEELRRDYGGRQAVA